MFFQCLKRFEIFYYIISIRSFRNLCLNMPIEYLYTKYQTFGFTFGFTFSFDFEGRSFSTFTFGFGYGQKNQPSVDHWLIILLTFLIMKTDRTVITYLLTRNEVVQTSFPTFISLQYSAFPFLAFEAYL